MPRSSVRCAGPARGRSRGGTVNGASQLNPGASSQRRFTSICGRITSTTHSHGWQVTAPPCECVVLVILPQMLVNLRCDEAPGFNWLAPFTVPPRERPRAGPAQRTLLRGMARRFAEIQHTKGAQRALWERLLTMEILLSLFQDWQPTASSALSDTHYQRVNRAIQMVFSRKALVTAGDAAAAC